MVKSILDKKKNKTYLYEKNNSETNIREKNYLKLIDTYKHTDGKGGKGPKEESGDKKTPEGLYKIVKAFFPTEEESLEKYGQAYLKINYPNKKDLELGRTGGGIALFGTFRASILEAIKNKKDITSGNIILKNKDIMSLYNQIYESIDDTIVYIANKKNKKSMKKLLNIITKNTEEKNEIRKYDSDDDW